MQAIYSRWDARVLFECNVPEHLEIGLRTRHVLERAKQGDANLRCADLSGADLRNANLRGADLTKFRDDIWAVLSAAPVEARAVLMALRDGKIDGSTYAGECACLVGTISNARGCGISNLGALTPDSHRLAETWFMQITPGNTPENHNPTLLAAEWVEQWLDAMHAAFGSSATEHAKDML